MVLVGIAVYPSHTLAQAVPVSEGVQTAPAVNDKDRELYRLMFEGNVIDSVQYLHALEHGCLPNDGALLNAAIPAERQTTWNQLHSQGVISAEELVQMLGQGKIGDLTPAEVRAFEELAPVYEPNRAKRLKYNIRKKHIAVDMIRFRQTTGAKWGRWKREAEERASREDIPIRFEGAELVRFNEAGQPVYVTVQNTTAADSCWTDEVRHGGSAPFGLSGTNITIAAWDRGNVRETHQEFGGRVQQVKASPVKSTHVTAVCGTLASAGVSNSSSMGMAPAATVQVYYYSTPLIDLPALIHTNPLCQVSNHSYTYPTGWSSWGDDWKWFGNVTVSTNEDLEFGRYGLFAQDVDEFCFAAPYHLPVYGAGNDGSGLQGNGKGGEYHWCWRPGGDIWINDYHPADGNYLGSDTLSYFGTAKNNLVVGSVGDAVGGYSTNSSAGWRSSFSGQGLTDDWRAKPDIMGNGEGLLTTDDWGTDNGYGNFSGTSLATPCVSGSLALLQELHLNIYGTNAPMLASTLKALVIHTAVNSKPDHSHSYAEGWGVLDTLSAAWVISNNAAWASLPHIKEVALGDGNMIEFNVEATGTNGLMATMVYTDPEGPNPPYSLDPTNIVLVNDLDMRIYAPDGATNYPFAYVEDSTNVHFAFKQIKGDNCRDNVERIYIEEPTNGVYTIQVTHKNSLSNGVQDVSIVVTGNSPTNAPDFEISSIGVDGSNGVVTLAWPGVVGALYSVDMSTNLMLHPGGWTTGTVMSANVESLSHTSAVHDSELRFHRIRRYR